MVAQEETHDIDELTSLVSSSADGSSPKALPPIWSEVCTLRTQPCILLRVRSTDINTRFEFNCLYVFPGHALPHESSQANDLGIIKARSKKEHYYSA